MFRFSGWFAHIDFDVLMCPWWWMVLIPGWFNTIVCRYSAFHQFVHNKPVLLFVVFAEASIQNLAHKATIREFRGGHGQMSYRTPSNHLSRLAFTEFQWLEISLCATSVGKTFQQATIYAGTCWLYTAIHASHVRNVGRATHSWTIWERIKRLVLVTAHLEYMVATCS